ncbi:hyaluronidase [Mesorhizobium sp. M1156]|uniref:hypothetical protein n=1 Tax=unclassified Mesorhizobium TaxID=325217 RepID=UPI0033375825
MQLFRKIILCAVGVLSPCLNAAGQSGAEFKVFQTMAFFGRPDFRKFGIEQLTVADPHVLGPDVPEAHRVQKALELPRANQYLAIDIEDWPLDGTNAERATSIAKYQATLTAFRKADPSLRLGLYSVLPMRDYWRAIGAGGNDAFQDWQSRNTEIASALVPYVDALFPSVYSPYGDIKAWKAYAEANLKEARRISRGKPVYCFLWPQFKTLAFVPGDLWAAELDTCKQFADGLVIWGPVGSPVDPTVAQWNEQAEWWQATVKFMRKIGKMR